MYKGSGSQASSAVDIKAEGIKTHGAYPNDVVWIQVLDGTRTTNLGAVKLTTDAPSASFTLDHDKTFILRLHSVESHFGGFSSCAGDVPLSVKANERYVITYSTVKTSCRILAAKTTGSAPLVEISETTGSIGGVQFSATVTR